MYMFSPYFSVLNLVTSHKLQLQLHKSPFQQKFHFTTAEIGISYTLKYSLALAYNQNESNTGFLSKCLISVQQKYSTTLTLRSAYPLLASTSADVFLPI